jgi:hypothetical protein
MAFFRFTRDKRGYENYFLVEPITRRGKSRTRVLYWFRSPPDVRVGIRAFDESVQRALEARYPDVHFDWKTILSTPIPSADTEKWRERRRAEKAERAARNAAAAEEAAEAPDADEDEPGSEPGDAPVVTADAQDAKLNSAPSETSSNPASSTPGAPGDAARRKRRRRRGRRTGDARRESPQATADPGAPDTAAKPTDSVGD